MDICPICGGDLEIDDEYMQDIYGPDYLYMIKPEQMTYFCTECEEAGTYEELKDFAVTFAESD